jgi:phosphohistidine phosphatase
MPRLILLRHAKSAWDTGASSDHDRPLSARGRQDAPVIGRWLRQAGWIPEVVLSSTATRTRQTWATMAPHLAPDAAVTFLPKLYLSGVRTVRPILAEQTAQTVLLIGHNPGWEDIASTLSGQDVEMTTCNAALLTSDAADWAGAAAGRWRLVDLLRPREPRS